MTTQKDRIEAAIRHIQTSVDIDPWAMELAVDALKAQIDKDTNVPNNDCISRQEVIRLILERGLYCDTQEDREVSADIIRQLPSAQPEQSIAEWQKDFREYINMLNIPRDDYNGIMEYINEVPSAQPEPCEDAVSRKLMYELGATCMARRDENGELVALGRLDMLPSVQPEVIRCKDCRYWHREIHNGIEYFNFSSCDLNHHGDGNNFYCADAEGRTDESD